MKAKVKAVTVQDCIRNAKRGRYAIVDGGAVIGFTKPTLREWLAAAFRRWVDAD